MQVCFLKFMWMRDEGSDDQYQKAQMLKAIRCYRNLHYPEYAVIFLYSPGGFYPFFIKPKHSGYVVFRTRRRKNKYR